MNKKWVICCLNIFLLEFIAGCVILTTGYCCTTENNIMILACSGDSNVGQLINHVAVELTKEGWARMFCLAGIGANLSGFVQSARTIPL